MNKISLSQDNILVLAEKEKTEKKSGKGDGIQAVLALMQKLRVFQEDLNDCIESQDITDNKGKLEQFDGHLDEMYGALLEIASGGIKTIRQKRVEGDESFAQQQPPMMNSNVIQKIP